MPIETNRLKLPLPLGNESVSRVGINAIFEKIDEGVATRGDVEELRQLVNEMDIPDASLTQKGKVQLSSKTNGSREDVAATEKALSDVMAEAISAKQLGVEQKANVVAALNSIGVSATTNETWSQLIAKLKLVKNAIGNAVPADVMAGKTFSNSSGSGLTGTYIAPTRSSITGINYGAIDLSSSGYARILFTIPVSSRYADVIGDSTETGDSFKAARIGITNTQSQSPVTVYLYLRDHTGRQFTLDSYSVSRVPNQEVQLWLYGMRIDRISRSVLFKGITGNAAWRNPLESIPSAFDFAGPIDLIAGYIKTSGVPANYSTYLSAQLITT